MVESRVKTVLILVIIWWLLRVSLPQQDVGALKDTWERTLVNQQQPDCYIKEMNNRSESMER